MGHDVTIGGERLGSGKRMKAYMHGYERSTHDLSYVWRSTMAAGTLVPFMTEVGLPGDTFDIDLDCDILTHPTIGPLFGNYKIQLDVFQVPIRLYQGKLHMNMLGIGMDMSKVPLPQLDVTAKNINEDFVPDNEQINPSCILSYLGIRGLGTNSVNANFVNRKFNAIPLLGYWDIYKNYYANKQEEIGAVIHKNPVIPSLTISDADIFNLAGVSQYDFPLTAPYTTWTPKAINNTYVKIILAGGLTTETDPAQFRVYARPWGSSNSITRPITELYKNWEINVLTQTIIGTNPIYGETLQEFAGMYYDPSEDITDIEPQIVTFPLTNIDDMRQALLSHFADTAYEIDQDADAPYGLTLATDDDVAPTIWSQRYSQEGLGLKTYNSDLFNNWIDTEWIDGVDGISAITAVSTAGDSFTIDELNLSKKIYDMLNRIAISGGSYDDWLDAVYTHERTKQAENPMYLGGLIKRLVFQEVISNAASEDQPLGTLAGRGRVSDYQKGGQITAKIDEPSYLMGIISLTPIVDYSQGNTWHTNLKTVNDFHKPALDEIGFQDLITDQMAYFDTIITAGEPVFKSAGKQPAWINYMTNVNKVLGNFADQGQQMFMVLNRRYTVEYNDTTDLPQIADLTTYIDPVKFNHIFADTRRDAQNFWAQIAVGITARRKMSAKVIPNL